MHKAEKTLKITLLKFDILVMIIQYENKHSQFLKMWLVDGLNCFQAPMIILTIRILKIRIISFKIVVI